MMKTVTFAREYRHKLDDLRTAHYEPGTMAVSNEVAEAAKAAGALQEDDADGQRSSPRD